MPQNTAIATQREWTRVIVLAPSPVLPPPGPEESATSLSADAETSGVAPTLAMSESLRTEFQKRDWFAVVQHDPYLAMAELALREKAQSARAAWGLQRMEGLALVIVDPQSWKETVVGDLCAAVRRWLPAASLWSASKDQIEPIALDAAPLRAPSELLRAQRVFDLDALVAALPRGPALSNGLPGELSHPAAQSKPSPTDIERGRLSRDEIDMLLQMDSQDDELPPQAREGQP